MGWAWACCHGCRLLRLRTSCSRYCQAGAHSLLFDMLVVAVWRHPTAISIAWSGLQLVAQGGMPRDLDSLVAEVKTLLCLLVALHCFQDLLERLSRHWWMHAHVWSMGEGSDTQSDASNVVLRGVLRDLLCCTLPPNVTRPLDSLLTAYL